MSGYACVFVLVSIVIEREPKCAAVHGVYVDSAFYPPLDLKSDSVGTCATITVNVDNGFLTRKTFSQSTF